MQRVLDDADLLLHIAERLPTREDVCNFRAVNRCTKTMVSTEEAKRVRHSAHPYVHCRYQYAAWTDAGHVHARLTISETFIPTDPMTKIMHVPLDDTAQSVLLSHACNIMKLDRNLYHSLSCKLLLIEKCTQDVAFWFLQQFLIDVCQSSQSDVADNSGIF